MKRKFISILVILILVISALNTVCFAETSADYKQKSQDAKEKLEDKREARDKEKLEKYIDNRLEYTSDCIALALTLASEAKLSFLEALEAQAELDEK